MKMSVEKKFGKPRYDKLLEEQYSLERPNHVTDKHLLMKLAVLGMLTTGIVLHTVCFAKPYLATYRATLILWDDYHTSIKGSYTIHVHMGLWQMCSKAWTSCVRWGGIPAQGDTDQYGGWMYTVFAIPGWVFPARGTSLTGIVIAAITDVIVVLHFIIRDKGQRLFPFLICLGALIGGTFVLISSAIVAFKYKSLEYHPDFIDAVSLMGQGSNARWTDVDISPFVGWGFAMEVVAIILMWTSGLLTVLGRKRVDTNNTTTNKAERKTKLFVISSDLFTDSHK